jgi:DNA-binding transcriptional LysR family regulator
LRQSPQLHKLVYQLFINAYIEMKPEFDWSLIRTFFSVMEQGSLLAAARRLGMSQPTLGRHINQLEQQLNVVLFERTGRALVPTKAAQQLAIHAAAMNSNADALARSLVEADSQLRGTVRITASQIVASMVLPNILQRLHQEAPDIAVEIVASNTLSNLLRREADIAIRMVRPQQSSLIAKKIAAIGVCVCAHESYIARRGSPRTAEELIHHDLIGFDTDETIIRGFQQFGAAITRDAFHIRTDDHVVMWESVRAGLGIGFVSHHLAKRDAQIEVLLPKLTLPVLPVWLTVHREIRTTPRIRAVYDFLAKEIPIAVAS